MNELYKITDVGGVVRYFFAKDANKALELYRKNYFYEDARAERVLTDQGYPIVRLKDVPKGSYFHRTSMRDGEFCEHSVVWLKGEYDHSTRKWSCYKFEDICNDRLFKGEERVTIDFTF